jgi:hypothetical protein
MKSAEKLQIFYSKRAVRDNISEENRMAFLNNRKLYANVKRQTKS